jgi:hypothetical protein
MRLRRARVPVLLTVALLLATVTTFMAQSAAALFTDSAAVPTNTFTAGTADISAAPASALLSASALAPGDKVTAPLTVTNAGTLQLRYAMTSSHTNGAFAAQLTLRIVPVVNVGACTGATDFSAAIYNSALSTAAFGNPAQGAHAGDRVLAAGTSEVLCFQAELPLAADNSAQGLTTTATFTFDAEQTANN